MPNTNSEYRDYRRQSVGAGGEPLHQQPSSTSARQGKKYADLDKHELEAEAKANFQRPLGVYVGDGQLKGVEGDEGGYIGGGNPFGDSPHPHRRLFPTNENAGTFAEKFQGDIEHAHTTNEEEEGYYGASNDSQPFSSFNEKGYTQDYIPGSARQPPSTGPLNYNPNDRHFVYPHEIPTYPTQNFYRRCVLTGFQIGSALGTTLGFNLIVIMALIWSMGRAFMRLLGRGPKPVKVEKEWEQRITGERFSSRAEYYAEFFGYECESLEVETEDGFVLRIHHLLPKKHKQLGHPVILQHGILSNSVTFMVNEERSLAFWLMEQGYDVYLSNIRTNFKMPHRHFPRSDPRYWAWSVEEIALYDLPAVVDFVHSRSGKKPAYIGHSQGTGTMFLALSRGKRPDLGNKLSCFIALAPAVYAGPVLRSFPFSLMRKFKSRKMWSLVFGVREFIPVISLLQGVLPSWLFGHIAVPVFRFIFGFNATDWVPRQYPKLFRSAAVANSSELLYYYMSKLSYNNCIFDTTTTEPWFPPSFPPCAIFYGTLDTLVLGKPLVERIRQHEPNVNLVKVVSIEGAEHQSPIWGVNAPTECFVGIKEVIEQTKDL